MWFFFFFFFYFWPFFAVFCLFSFFMMWYFVQLTVMFRMLGWVLCTAKNLQWFCQSLDCCELLKKANLQDQRYPATFSWILLSNLTNSATFQLRVNLHNQRWYISPCNFFSAIIVLFSDLIALFGLKGQFDSPKRWIRFSKGELKIGY